MILSTVTGHETVASASARLSAFLLPSTGFVHREVALDMASKAGVGVSKVGEGRRVPAVSGVAIDLGSWTTQSYLVPDGLIVRIAARNTRPGFQPVSLLLRGREQGALRRFRFVLTCGPRTVFQYADFEARCDLLTVDQALAAGANLRPQDRVLYDTRRWTPFVSMQEIEPEVAPVAVTLRRRIRNTDGEAVVVAAPKRRRVIDI